MLAERFNGTSWVVQPTPVPTAAKGSALAAVSCTGAADCSAVGDYTNSGGTELTLGEQWRSPHWYIQGAPAPAGASASVFSGVSCPVLSYCIAVGHSTDATSNNHTLAERWDGTSWAIQTTPNPSGATNSRLNGISCTTMTACTAVGTADGQTLAERFDGTTWTIQPTALSGNLLAVSCPSTTSCTAVGSTTDGSGDVITLAAGWDGTKWTFESTPTIVNNPSMTLGGVSCVASVSCIATGDHMQFTGDDFTLADTWNGTSWTMQTTPSPTGTSFTLAKLVGVSCTATSACSSVGDFVNGAGAHVTLAERWDGANWTVQTTPNPPSAMSSTLSGVSCTGSTTCVAAGTYEINPSAPLTLAERWNGTSWSIDTTPNPAGAKGSELTGASCRAASACTAVGDYTNSAGTVRPLAERYF
jgi:hypothetical protein